MATVFFARTGIDPNRVTQNHHVAIAAIVSHLSAYESRFRKEPPVINPGESPSPYSGPTLTVVEVEPSEVCASFPNPGYYWFPNLSPSECSRLLGLGEPSA